MAKGIITSEKRKRRKQPLRKNQRCLPYCYDYIYIYIYYIYYEIVHEAHKKENKV